MCSPIAIIDLIVILPFYLSLFISIDLRYLRLLRLLRLLKLSHYIRSMDVFVKVITSELASLASAVFAVLVLVVLAACLMFTLEHKAQPDQFKTVLDAIWWAVVTMTTVGYGDMTPITAGGKILAILIMLLGVGTVALPAGMLAARFSEELQNRKSAMTAEVINALEDGELTEQEQKLLKTMSRQYGISEEDLNQIIHNQRLELGHKLHCPHCGESVFDAPAK
ncbi:Ion transport protein [Oceanospirillum multiglobuliferum]|uniref:potassium channel family protein n=1 Tax=Oceanospirillum multiglobuliferum TaxID=64969 RepID=UPI00099A3A1C|nr:potassium channel family protein [Oceanospirillum multiglobuliferum]SJZ62777.1 Ion transport protein [Oceanospirillum multiglobuliferum]